GAAVRALAGADVEIGGHTYRAFQPLRLHDWFRRVAGSYYGPAWFQRWDAGRTLALIRRPLGGPAPVWRAHPDASHRTPWRVPLPRRGGSSTGSVPACGPIGSISTRSAPPRSPGDS